MLFVLVCVKTPKYQKSTNHKKHINSKTTKMKKWICDVKIFQWAKNTKIAKISLSMSKLLFIDKVFIYTSTL